MRLLQRPFHALAFGDVACQPLETDHAALVSEDLYVLPEPDLRATAGDDREFIVGVGALLRGLLGVKLTSGVPEVRPDQGQIMTAEQRLGGHLEDAFGSRIDEVEVPVVVSAIDDVAGAVHDLPVPRLLLLQDLLCAPRLAQRQLQLFLTGGQCLCRRIALRRAFARQLHQPHTEAGQDRESAAERDRRREHQWRGLARIGRHQRRAQQHRGGEAAGRRGMWQPSRQPAAALAVAPAEKQEPEGADQCTGGAERRHPGERPGGRGLVRAEEPFDDNEQREDHEREPGHPGSGGAEPRQTGGQKAEANDQKRRGAAGRDAKEPGGGSAGSASAVVAVTDGSAGSVSARRKAPIAVCNLNCRDAPASRPTAHTSSMPASAGRATPVPITP